MKTIHFFTLIKHFTIATFLCMLFAQCSPSKMASKLSSDELNDMIANKDFRFVAQQVNPMRGRTRILTSEYDVVIKNDSLVSFLPYFGRAYQAPMNPSEGGIQFTSTQFSYDVTSGKKDDWTLIIKPKDYQQVQAFNFKVFANGSASLQVISTNKDPISFNGHVFKNK